MLSAAIEDGSLGDGKLPSENELSARFGVSRVSLRRALSDLESQGLITRHHGIGTFVNSPTLVLVTLSIDGHTDTALISGQPTPDMVREIKAAQVEEAEGDVARLLQLPAGRRIYHLTRVFSLNGNALSIDDSYYPVDRYPDFLEKVTDEISTYRLLAGEYGVRFGAADRYFGVSFVTKTTAPWLNRPVRDPLLTIDKVAYDTDGAIVHISRLQTVPARVQVRMHTDPTV